MKRTMIVFLACVFTVMIAICGCSKEDNTSNCDTTNIARVVITPNNPIVLYDGNPIAFEAKAYTPDGSLISCGHFHWLVTVADTSNPNIAIDSNGVLTSHYDTVVNNPWRATVTATIFQDDGTPVSGATEVFFSTAADYHNVESVYIVFSKNEAVVSIDSSTMITIKAMQRQVYYWGTYDSDFYLPRDLSLSISSSCDSIVIWVLSDNVLNIYGHDYGECALTASFVFDGETISATLPVSVPRGAGRLHGTVRDLLTDAPVVGASVTVNSLLGRTITVTTDAFGYYNFPSIPAGTRIVTVEGVGYESQNLQATVVANGSSSFPVVLLKPLPTICRGLLNVKFRRESWSSTPNIYLAMNNVEVWLSDYPAYKCTTKSIFFDGCRYNGYYELCLPPYALSSTINTTLSLSKNGLFQAQTWRHFDIIPGQINHEYYDLTPFIVHISDDEFINTGKSFAWSADTMTTGEHLLGILDIGDLDATIVDMFIENIDLNTHASLDVKSGCNFGNYTYLHSSDEGHWVSLYNVGEDLRFYLDIYDSSVTSQHYALSISEIRYWK